MQKIVTAQDAQGLAFVTGQAYKINSRVYEARYPDWDFGRFAYVDTSGPAWSPGVLTYMSDVTGKAEWQSGYAKDADPTGNGVTSPRTPIAACSRLPLSR